MSDLTASLEARARTLDIIVGVLRELEQMADTVIYTSKHGEPPSSPCQHRSGQHLYISIYGRLDLYNTSSEYRWEGSERTITTMRKLWYLWEQLDGACGPDSKLDDDEDEKEDAANRILWEEVVVVRGWCDLIKQQIALLLLLVPTRLFMYTTSSPPKQRWVRRGGEKRKGKDS